MWSRSHHGPARVELAIIAVDRSGLRPAAMQRRPSESARTFSATLDPDHLWGPGVQRTAQHDVGVRLPSPPRGLLWGPTRKVLRIPGTTSPLRTRVSRTPGTRTGPLP